MKICLLRSGSSGNCLFLEHDSKYLLVDAGGMSQKKYHEILQEVNVTPDLLSGIVFTHTHSDHVNYSTIQVCRKYGIPIWIHELNIPVMKSLFGKIFEDVTVHSFGADGFQVEEVSFESFAVSHDAAEVTSGFKIREEGSKQFFTYAADLGFFPDGLKKYFSGASYIFLESNHDTDLLWNNPRRPYIHKRRVASDSGHLSNTQCADALVKIIGESSDKPRGLILCHLSNDHNSPRLAIDTVGSILNNSGISVPIYAASRHEKTVFFEYKD